MSGDAGSPAGGEQEPFQDEVEQLLGDNDPEVEEEVEEEEGEDLFGDNMERYIHVPWERWRVGGWGSNMYIHTSRYPIYNKAHP